MKVSHFTDGPTHCEVWQLPDTGWDDWSEILDRFLAHAIRRIAHEYADERVEWLVRGQVTLEVRGHEVLRRHTPGVT